MEALRDYYVTLPAVDFSQADDVKKSDAIYKLFQNATQTLGEMLTEDTVKEANLDKNIPTVLIMHGWTTNDTSPWYAPLKDALFSFGPHNVFYLDWSIAGNRSYTISCANTKPMGKIIAEFLVASGVPPSKIHVIGHSLGSQLASFIGKSMTDLTGRKIGRITALDPAGPRWSNADMDPKKDRLCPDDAEFVDVIHTDIFFSGFTSPIGHVDFYPNDGKHQPGCPERTPEAANCSHARSTLYYIESVGTKSNATEAEYKEIERDVSFSVKENAKQIIFGHHVDTKARGVYIMETNSTEPFLK